jgi:hypothetical protein
MINNFIKELTLPCWNIPSSRIMFTVDLIHIIYIHRICNFVDHSSRCYSTPESVYLSLSDSFWPGIIWSSIWASLCFRLVSFLLDSSYWSLSRVISVMYRLLPGPSYKNPNQANYILLHHQNHTHNLLIHFYKVEPKKKKKKKKLKYLWHGKVKCTYDMQITST